MTTPKALARIIREMNRWRRGLGRYAEVGVEPPTAAQEWGVRLEEAALTLDAIGEAADCVVEARERLLQFRGWAEEGDDVMDALGRALELLGARR